MSSAQLNRNPILIQGGWILDPSQSRACFGDLLIQDGKISAIEPCGAIPVQPHFEVISAKGFWVIPGLIDMHVHFREPGFEYKETIATGSKAAVAGGFTSVACMANTHPVNDNSYVTAFIREKAKEVALCRVFPVGAVTKGLKGEELAEMGGMFAEGACAFSDDGMPVMNSYLMRKAMDYSKIFGVPIISHSEDANLVGQGVMNEGALSNELGLRGNPAASEEIMVAREIALCRLTRASVHIAHVSTALAVEHIRRAKEEGLPITAEVSPHHLTLTEDHLRSYDPCFKMAPPLRTQQDVEVLRKALAEQIIDVIATDHAPHGCTEKNVEFDQAANGILGLQTALPVSLSLVHSGILTPLAWIRSLSQNPARILKLPYGTLEVGKSADITLLDPEKEWTLGDQDLLSKSKNSPYLGHKLKGFALATWVGGKLTYSAFEQKGRSS